MMEKKLENELTIEMGPPKVEESFDRNITLNEELKNDVNKGPNVDKYFLTVEKKYERNPKNDHCFYHFCCKLPYVLCCQCNHNCKVRLINHFQRYIMIKAGFTPDSEKDMDREYWKKIIREEKQLDRLYKKKYETGKDFEIKTIDVPLVSGTSETKNDKTMMVHVLKPKHKPIEKLPILVFYHGGGYVIGRPYWSQYINTIIKLYKYLDGRCYIVAPDYRLAPENPFPIPLNDSYDCLRWISSTSSFEILPETADRKQLILGGDSAGANLATVLTMLVVNQEQVDFSPAPFEMIENLKIKYLLAFCPYYIMPNTKSWDEHKNAPILPNWLITWMMESYLGSKNKVDLQKLLKDTRINPVLSGHKLKKFPCTILASSGEDPLRDDSFTMEEHLKYYNIETYHFHDPHIVHVGYQFQKTSIIDDSMKMLKKKLQEEYK